MIVGFTGTQKGISWRQKDALRQLIESLEPKEFHHGDCVGADAQAHAIMMLTGSKIVIHPPLDGKKRAFSFKPGSHRSDWGHRESELSVVELPPRDYLERNRDIVDACNLLVATPSELPPGHPRSGTWYTIRYAERVGRSTIIIYPDGSQETRA